MNVFGIWGKFNLRTKLLLSYFFLIVFPLVFFSFFTYKSVSQTINGLIQFSARQSFDQTASYLTEKLKKTIDASNVILMDSAVNDMLTQSNPTSNFYNQFGDYQKLDNFLLALENSESVNNIVIYLNQKLTYVSVNDLGGNTNYLSLQNFQSTLAYKKLMATKNNTLWTSQLNQTKLPGSPSKVSLLRSILDPNNYSRQIAVLRIDILEKTLTDTLSKAIPTAHSFSYLENSNNEIITSFQYPASNSFLNQFQVDGTENCVYFQSITGTDGKKASYNACPVANTDWTMITVTPSEDLTALNHKIRDGLFILLLIIGTAAYAAAFGISHYFTRRINKLIMKMRRLEQGNFDVHLLPEGNDEITELTQRFNNMAEKMYVLVQEQFRIGQEAKASELKALQAQINPHFLYNTLDLINWTALNNNVPEIAGIVKSLSKFYKISLNKGSDIVTLAEEFEHVRLYAGIQNRRYENAFHFTFDTEESIMNFMTVKLILQPLVENSIIHGILKKSEKSGSIIVSAKSMQNHILLSVHDDGVGMDEATLKGLFDMNIVTHGYGIKNINQRIKLYFGEQYGLTITSEPGKGTQATIMIPKKL